VNLAKTLVVWRRLGKEHGHGREFRLNPPSVVRSHIEAKVDAFRQTPDDDWRWWQASDELIVERPLPATGFGSETLIYYLPRRNWAIVEHARFPSLGPDWPWYIHVGSTCWEEAHGSWLFTDLFCDVIVQGDLRTHSVLDLDDLAEAFGIGLISGEQLAAALESTQELVDAIRCGRFPPAELAERETIAAEMAHSGGNRGRAAE
jgi:hypothetical protein